MKEKILQILKTVPPKLSYEELIKVAIEDDMSIGDLLALYEEFYTLIEEIFDALEDPEDAKKENNSDTNEATD